MTASRCAWPPAVWAAVCSAPEVLAPSGRGGSLQRLCLNAGPPQDSTLTLPPLPRLCPQIIGPCSPCLGAQQQASQPWAAVGRSRQACLTRAPSPPPSQRPGQPHHSFMCVPVPRDCSLVPAGLAVCRAPGHRSPTEPSRHETHSASRPAPADPQTWPSPTPSASSAMPPRTRCVSRAGCAVPARVGGHILPPNCCTPRLPAARSKPCPLPRR
jgi:hypothetical protein